MGERGEQGLIQQLVTQTAVEALHEGVLRRLAQRNVIPFDQTLLGPTQDRHAGEISSVVGDAGQRPATRSNDGIKAGERQSHLDAGHALPAVVPHGREKARFAFDRDPPDVLRRAKRCRERPVAR
jgi:hypothetical protein